MHTAHLNQTVLTIQSLPDTAQQQVIDFVDFLKARYASGLDNPSLTPTSQNNQIEPKYYRKAGSLKGQIIMADDFDKPLEDFKDYM